MSRALDLAEELRLRRWARDNYVSFEERDPAWHAVVLDEMCRRDLELPARDPCRRRSPVPLAPAGLPGFGAVARSGAPDPGAETAVELHYT